jgi:hypothetical protein
MKIHYYTGARRSGKSTIGKFVAHDKPNSLILTLYKNPNLGENVCSYEAFKNRIHGNRFKNLVLDEYQFLSLKEKQWLYVNLFFIPELKNIYVFTTPKHQYSKDIVEFVIACKKDGLNLHDTCHKIEEKFTFPLPFMSFAALCESVSFLYWDLYTAPDSDYLEIIRDDANFFTNDNIKNIPNVDYYHKTELTGKFTI